MHNALKGNIQAFDAGEEKQQVSDKEASIFLMFF
jgi:hypothetical protein